MRKLLALLVALVSTVPLAFGGSASASGPDSHKDSLVDGCQRSQAMLLTLSTPEWEFVHKFDVMQARLCVLCFGRMSGQTARLKFAFTRTSRR